MSRAFDRLKVKDNRFFTDSDGHHHLPSRHPFARSGRIVEFRPFYWNVPAYRETVGSSK